MSNVLRRNSRTLLILALMIGLSAWSSESLRAAGPRSARDRDDSARRPGVLRVYKASRSKPPAGRSMMKANCTAYCGDGSPISCEGPEVGCIDNSGCYDANDYTLNWHECDFIYRY